MIFNNPFVNWKSLKGTLANSKDPLKMSHNAGFHQCLLCLLRQNGSSEKEILFFFIIEINFAFLYLPCFVLFFTSQPTAMVMSGRSVHLTTLFS